MKDRVIVRRAARVLIFDASHRVLLFRGCDPALPDDKYWYSPGGGVEDGETDRQAASRELREETRVHVPPEGLIGPVLETDDEFGFAGRWVRQRNVFFTWRVAELRVAPDFHDLEGASVDQHRWWSRGDLEATVEQFYPQALPRLFPEAPCRAL
ncbi:MAG: NUDIX hydrolase [Stackebrandtia sp.]